MTQVRVGWRAYVNPFTPEDPGTPNTIDQDSTNFIIAAGISDSVQTSAIETLVSDLKTYGLWTKMKAIYPFVGGSAASHKWNLKDPRDLDAAYRLTFMGGGTHDVNGYKGNGTTAYAITYINPSVNLSQNNIHASWYSKLNITGAVQAEIGQVNGNFKILGYSINGAATGWVTRLNNSTNSTIVSTTNTIGFYQMSRINSLDYIMQKNSTQTTITKTSETPTSSNIILLGSNSTTELSGRQLELVTIGDGLTSTECSNLYIVVQKFQTTLGRHVGTPYVSDPDAVAFLNAAGITDGTQAAAINTLVIRMKADGVWTKMKAIYPFVGGTAFSHKFNLKDPRDLDAAYRLVFNGGGAHSSTGYKGNGSNSYADSKFPANTLSPGNAHLSFYNRTTALGSGYVTAIQDNSSWDANKTVAFGVGNIGNGGVVGGYFAGGGVNSTTVKTTAWTSLSLLSSTATNSYKIYNAGIVQGTSTTNSTNTFSTSNLVIGAHAGALNYIGTYETAFVSFGNGLTDAEATNLYTAVQEFQTTLGRQTDVPLVSDTDAQAFLNAANITSFQQASAVNKLVVDLKAAGVWTKMKAIYPFVGGSAASHKWNLKDPRDLDAAYRLVFNGGWTHTSTGAQPNGTNAYGDTYLNPFNHLANNNYHLSHYSRTQQTNTNAVDIAAINGGISMIGLDHYYAGVSSKAVLLGDYTTNTIVVNNTNTKGLLIGSRTTQTIGKMYFNGSQLGNTLTISNANLLPSNTLYISANHSGSAAIEYSGKETAFVTIGDGLSDTESTALYNAVETYQTSLGRGVNTPIYNNGLVLNLDAGNANSYPGTGTTWFDLAAGNNGTLTNGPTYDTANGGSLLFDGVNDYVDLGSNFKFVDKDLTLDFWVKCTDNSNYYHDIILMAKSDQSTGVGLLKSRSGTNNGSIYFYFGNAYLVSSMTGTQLVDAGIINYTAVAKKESGLYKIYLYRNGVLDGSLNTAISSYDMNTFTNFFARIGSGGPTYPEIWQGNIYSGKVYTRALSATEILNNFNSTRGRFGL